MGFCGKNPTQAPALCPMILSELNPCQNWYSVKDKVTGRVLDVPASFAPTGLHAVGLKLILALVAWGVLAYCFVEVDHGIFFFSHFSYIALVLQCIYHLLSLVNSTCPTLEQPKDDQDPVRGRAKATWFFFNMSLHASITATILYWSQDYQRGDGIDLLTILPNGPTAILILLDGMWINSIPIRLFHWFSAVLPLQLAYTGWTLAHAYLDLDNPTRSDDEEGTNDDAIYREIVWKDDFVGTLTVFLIMILAVGPVLQFVLFLFSLYAWPLCCMGDKRRYTTSAATFAEERSLEQKSTASQSNGEEVSIFASWG